MLREAGCTVWRVGFNAGDRAFWFHRASYIPFRDRAEDWPARIAALIAEKGVTDLVLYGDTRQIHAEAIAAARAAGLTIHVFEEGYIRPYWVTYERGGANGHSRLMQMTVAEMRAALATLRHGRARAACPLGRHAPAHLLRGALSLVRDVPERAVSPFPAASRPWRRTGIPALPAPPDR